MTIDPTAATDAALDIDSIKKTLDSLDPAALLPDLPNLFSKAALICRIAVLIGPVILLVLGLAYLFLSPKEANYYFGYRCYYGMGSVRAWRFTQRIAGMILGGLGLILTVIMTVISLNFGSMELSAMVWRALWCLVWEAGLALAATLAVNILAMVFFDGKGNMRRKKQA